MNKKFTTAVFTVIILLFTALSLRAQTQAQYSFFGNTNDTAGNNYNATNNNVTYASDIANLAAHAGQFTGTGSYLSLPNGWIGSNQYIGFSVWFKTDNNMKPAGIAYAGQEAIGNYPVNWTPLMWIDSSGYLRAYYYDGTMVSSVSTDTVNDNQWHHAVFVMYYNGTINQELWVDGKSMGLASNLGGGGNSFANIYIGACNARDVAGMPDAWLYFNGRIDEVIGFIFSESDKYKMMHNYDLAITEHPQDVTVVEGSSTTMHISHSYFNPDSTYTYQWYWNGSIVMGATDSTLTINNASAADEGLYKCEVTNSNNYMLSSYEGELSVTPVSVKNVGNESVVKMYPNPAKDIVYIDLESDKVADVSIVSLTGQTLISRSNVKMNARLDVSELPAGVYSICIKDADGTRYSKFVKSGN